MTEHSFDHATLTAPDQPSPLGATKLKGMHVLETDEPLLATLKPREQAVLHTTGSYEDRARKLGVPVGTLRSRLHRARAKLVALRSQPHVLPH